MSKPFDGAISRFHEVSAPQKVRDAIAAARRSRMVTDDYPYEKRMDRRAYGAEMAALQHQLVRLQADIHETGKRIVVIFEGRDAAGKGGTIKRFRDNLNPRVCRTVALPRPTEREQGEWYFQRYIAELPSAGEMVLFDRSWYNRAVVEKVFGFCTDAERARFFAQVTEFERMLVSDGITLIKLWLNVSRAEQLRRFLAREIDPLKQWKLSWIDVEGLNRWEAYSHAIAETFRRSHAEDVPWTVIRADDKRRARLAAICVVLARVQYDGKDPESATPPDPKIAGGPDIWPYELDG